MGVAIMPKPEYKYEAPKEVKITSSQKHAEQLVCPPRRPVNSTAGRECEQEKDRKKRSEGGKKTQG